MSNRRISILLTAAALTVGMLLLGAGALTLMLTATGPAMPAKDMISNYVAGGMLTLIACGIIAFVATKGRL